MLTGEIPEELAHCQQLRWLSLGSNLLIGRIPGFLSGLVNLKWLNLCENSLEGEIPDLERLKNLRWLHLDKNRLTGRIPSHLARLPNLSVLDLSHNGLRGEIPVLGQQLKILDLSRNFLTKMPQDLLFLPQIELLDLSRNGLEGPLLGLCSVLEAIGPARWSKRWVARKEPHPLRQLRLNHNDFSGEIPKCLVNKEYLKHLSLNNNRLEGVIPSIGAKQLVVLALHSNRLSGPLPSFLSLKHLAVLTVHENALDGALPEMRLVAPCIDNTKLSLHGLGCSTIRQMLRGGSCEILKHRANQATTRSLFLLEIEKLEEQIPIRK